MASSTEEIAKLVVKISADTENAKQGLEEVQNKVKETVEEAESSLHRYMTATSQIGVGFTSLGRLATRIGSAINQNITLPLAAAGAGAAATAIEFLKLRETTMVGFEKLLGDAESANQYMNDLLALAKKTPFAQEAFYDAARTLLAMGFSAEEAMVNLQAMTDAAVASGRGTEGIDTLTRALGKMKASGKITLEALNMMTDMGIPAVTVLANQLGVTTEEFFSMTKSGEVLAEDAIPLLIEGLQKGTDGLNGMTAAYEGLAEATKVGTLTGAFDSLHTAWRTFSLELFDTDTNKSKLIELLGNLKRILENLAPIFKGATDNVTSFLDKLNELTSEFADYLETTDPEKLKKIGDAILTIASAGPILLILGGALKMVGSGFRALSGVAKIAESLQELRSSGNKTVNMFSELSGKIKDIPAKLNKLAGSLLKAINPVNFFKKSFEGIKGLFGKIAEGSKNLITKFKGIGSAVKGIIPHISSFATKLKDIYKQGGGGLNGVLSLLKNGFLNLKGAIKNIPGLLTRLGGAFSPLTLVILAVVGVVLALKENWEKIVEIFKGFIEKLNLEEKFAKIKEAVDEFAKAIGVVGGDGGGLESLLGILEKIGEFILIGLTPVFGLLGGIFDGIISALPGIINAFTGVIEFIQGLIDLIVGIFTGDGEKIKDAWQQIWDAVIQVVSGLWDAICGFFSGLVEGVIAFFTELWDELVGHSIVPDTVNGVVEWFGKLPELILGGIEQFISDVISFFVDMGSDIVEEVSKLPEDVLEWFTQMGDDVSGFMSGLAEDAWGWGSDMVDGIIGGIGSMISSAASAASNLAGTISSYLHFSRPDVGPLREYEEWMPDFVEGMTQGLNKSAPRLIGAVSNLNKQMSDTMGLADLNASGSFTQKAIISDSSSMSQKLQRIIDMMSQFFPEAIAGMNQTMVLDTGVLVAQTAPAFDNELGKLSIRKGRGR